MIQLSPIAWGAVAAGLVIAGLGIALKVQSSRLESCKEKHAAFVAQVKANGEIAEKARVAKEAADKSAKEKSDAEFKRLRGANAGLAKRLRDGRATGGILPRPAPVTTGVTTRACFDHALLERALQRLDEGVSGLVAEGDDAALRLKLAQEWARDALK